MPGELVWVPGERLGEFRFGSEVEAHLESDPPSLAFEEHCRETGWDVYLIPGRDDVSVCVEDGLIVSVASYAECLFDGVNLIGLSLERARGLIGSDPLGPPESYEVDDCMEQVYEFEEAGAQVWVSRSSVVAVICGAVNHDA